MEPTSWTMSIQALHVLWQRAYARVLSGEWAKKLKPKYSDLPINFDGGTPLQKGERLKTYIINHDADNPDDLLLGGVGLLDNIELRIYDEAGYGLRDKFMLYEAGIALPWPKMPTDPQKVFLRYDNEFFGLTSVNLPGYQTITPTQAIQRVSIQMEGVSFLEPPKLPMHAPRHDPESDGVEPLDKVKEDLRNDGYTHFVEDVSLYRLFIGIPRLIGYLWSRVDKTTYDQIRSNIARFKEEVEDEMDGLPKARVIAFSDTPQLTIGHDGIRLPLLPDYPSLQTLFESWASGEAHNVMFSDTPTA